MKEQSIFYVSHVSVYTKFASFLPRGRARPRPRVGIHRLDSGRVEPEDLTPGCTAATEKRCEDPPTLAHRSRRITAGPKQITLAFAYPTDQLLAASRPGVRPV
jgi:hypothetical protein